MAGTLDTSKIIQMVNCDTAGNALLLVGTSASPNVSTTQGNGTIASAQVSVATTATQLVAARATRQAVTIVNHGTTDVLIGLSGVTTSTGLLLAGVKGQTITIYTTAAVYGIVGTGTQTVSVLEAY